MLEWEERTASGTPVSPADLCPDDPELASRLADEIRLLEAFDALIADGDEAIEATPAAIGKYVVEGVLGRGGMGVVYRGWDPALHRTVAIKMIGVVPWSTSRLRERFEKEGQVLAQLKHPNIVTVYEAGVHDGLPYLVMEHVTGGSLADHRDQLAPKGSVTMLNFMEKVARALQFAHDKGVLHRDLKPANILIAANGEPLVADFGLAKLLDTDAVEDSASASNSASTPTGLTAHSARPGTPAYMAPEQLDPEVGETSARSDVWALGVILWELVSGRRPSDNWHSEDGSARGRFQMSRSDQRRAGRRLTRIITKCLQSNAKGRFASAGAVANALASVRNRRRRLRIAVPALLVALFLSVAAGLVWRESRPERVYGRATSPIVARIEAGQEVDLIPEQGLPPYVLRSGEGTTKITRGPDGLEVDSPGMAVVELLPTLPADGHVVTARLRHDHSLYQQLGLVCVGLSTSSFLHTRAEGVRQQMLRLASFTECRYIDKIPTGFSSFWVLDPPDGPPRVHQYATPNSTGAIRADLTQGKLWVEMSMVRTGPEEVAEFQAGAVSVGPFQTDDEVYRRHRQSILTTHEAARGVAIPADPPRSLSLVVCGGKCTVSRITVSKRPRPNP